MKPDLYFRISVIDAGLQLATHLRSYPEVSIIDAARQLRSGAVFRRNFDYDAASTIWDRNGSHPFRPSPNRIQELRDTIFNMALLIRPFWAKVSPLGRDRVRAVLSDDQIQCLRYAELLGRPESAVWKWWDMLAEQFRDERAHRLLAIGRQGELLSMRHERFRLESQGIKRAPYWKAVDDNLAGYDIESFDRFDGVTRKVFLEVKSTTSRECIFILNRREWQSALLRRDVYRFHFWLLPQKSLWVAMIRDIEPHVPQDMGQGEWEEVRFDFRDRPFVSVPLGPSDEFEQ